MELLALLWDPRLALRRRRPTWCLSFNTCMSLDLASLRNALLRHAVTDSQTSDAISIMPDSTTGVILYGSRARDDFLPESDVDLLAIVEEPRGSIRAGLVNISCYTTDQLTEISGTLFGMHLCRDGIVVSDSTGSLESILNGFLSPDGRDLLGRVRYFAQLLSVNHSDLQRYLGGLIRLARYLLRTAIYAEAIRINRPCFSIRELSALFEDPRLTNLLSSGPLEPADLSVDLFNELADRLQDLVGEVPSSRYESLAQLAVVEWDSDRDIATLAILAMSEQGDSFDYSELPKVLL